MGLGENWSVQLEQLPMIAQGNTAEIYRLGGGRILKLFREGLPKEVSKHEFDVTTNVQKIVKNVPNAFDFIKAEGRYGIVYDEIAGADMLHTILHTPWKLKEHSVNLARYHIGIQKETDRPLNSVKKKLSRDIECAKELSDDKKAAVKKYLSGLPDGRTLCHFDFHPGNVLLQDGKPVVIDWMTACVGDPCADAARTMLMLRFGELPHTPLLVRAVLRLVKKRMGKYYLEEYKRLTGCSLSDIEKWELPVAAARLREWIPENEKKTLARLVRKKLKIQELT